jgi:hypothetical protein
LNGGNGVRNITATQTDQAGNTGSANVNVNLLTTGPTVTITAPAANSYTNSPSETVTGTCQGGLNVVIAGSGVATGSTVLCGVAGTYSGTATLTTGNGVRNITATQTDLAGNMGSANVNVNLLTTGPTVTITAPAANSYSNSVSQNVGGNCEAGLNVVIAGSGVATGATVMCSAMGAYTGAVTLTAGNGVRNITATQTDQAGNVGSANENVTDRHHHVADCEHLCGELSDRERRV